MGDDEKKAKQDASAVENTREDSITTAKPVLAEAVEAAQEMIKGEMEFAETTRDRRTGPRQKMHIEWPPVLEGGMEAAQEIIAAHLEEAAAFSDGWLDECTVVTPPGHNEEGLVVKCTSTPLFRK